MIRNRPLAHSLTCLILLPALAVVPALSSELKLIAPNSNLLLNRLDSAAKLKPYSPQASRDALKWADRELRRMSIEEKIGQLISVASMQPFSIRIAMPIAP